MKIFGLILTLSAVLAFLPQVALKAGQMTLDEKNIVFQYEKNQLLAFKEDGKVPFTGIVIGKDEKGNLVKKLEFKDSQPHGTWSYFYSNGGLKSQFQFEKGLLEGEDKLFYENGKIRQLTHYRAGRLHGALKVFNPDGQLKGASAWDNGKKVN